ncbi:MAG TPA: hypothetical protein VLE73_02430 [Candidatus Saccharimonadales bacterium]|nr:hypothetical protein [Candidatus Saccharimonadales bacterium]
MLDKKLQLKDGQTIALIGDYPQLPIAAPQVKASNADAVIVFTVNKAELHRNLNVLKTAAENNKLTWVAYPKAKLLDTDINRDIIRAIANENGLDPVRQIALDETWSTLRLKSLTS